MSESTVAIRRDPAARRNRWCFGVGAFGRDLVFTLIGLWLIYYLTEVLTLDDTTLLIVTLLVVGTQIVNGFVDLVAGGLIDSSRNRWGRLRPWLLGGGLLSGVATVLLFADTGLAGWRFAAVFGLLNLLWGVSWAFHEVAYWSVLPALSQHPDDRARLASTAKVFTTLGAFTVAAGTLPLTGLLQQQGLSVAGAWFWLAVSCAVLLNLGLLVTGLGVRSAADTVRSSGRLAPRALVRTLLRNDQTVWAALAYLLFMLSSALTTACGPYFFRYVYGDAEAFSTFVLIVGVGQLAGYLVFPPLRARIARRRLFTGCAALMVTGYAGLLVAPANLIVLGVGTTLIFFLGSVVQLLLIVYLADTIEYGQWRFGERHNALTSALAPLIHKVSIAMSVGVVGAMTVGSGINRALDPVDLSDQGRVVVRVVMFAVPALLLVAAIVVWRARLVLDEGTHARLVADLGSDRSRPS